MFYLKEKIDKLLNKFLKRSSVKKRIIMQDKFFPHFILKQNVLLENSTSTDLSIKGEKDDKIVTNINYITKRSELFLIEYVFNRKANQRAFNRVIKENKEMLELFLNDTSKYILVVMKSTIISYNKGNPIEYINIDIYGQGYLLTDIK